MKRISLATLCGAILGLVARRQSLYIKSRLMFAFNRSCTRHYEYIYNSTALVRIVWSASFVFLPRKYIMRARTQHTPLTV